MGMPEIDALSQLSLPPGFRFYPTDEELLVQYLCRKVAGHDFNLEIIAEIDLYKFDPWVLPSKAIFGEKEWYFFSPRDRKYPNGSRPNRVAGSGYWKATGTDKVITTEGRRVGIKKALVFYIGKAPKGTKTNWIMHEYRLLENTRKNGSSKLDDWVLCRIYKKHSSTQKPTTSVSSKEVSNDSSSSSHLEDALESFPEMDDRFFDLPRMNSLRNQQHDHENLNSQNLGSGNFDWASLLGVNPAPEFAPENHSQAQTMYTSNDMYLPSIPPLRHVESPPEKVRHTVDEEVQSEHITQRVHNSVFFQQNPNVLTQNYSNSFEPFGFRYPNNPGGLGFRQ